jgi:biotin carboxyl carrier protein
MDRTEVRSEMPGTVKEVLVAAGEAVTTGQELVILESMKMEVPVEAPRDGAVHEVLVGEGAVVEEGQVVVALA